MSPQCGYVVFNYDMASFNTIVFVNNNLIQ